MTDSKTYLNVPYAQKEAAKALGARWDAARKKWYVPAGKDIALFSQWHDESSDPTPALKTTSISKAKSPLRSSDHKALTTGSSGVITYPSIADFVAYTGDAPPWE
jgi:hypothetical protein